MSSLNVVTVVGADMNSVADVVLVRVGLFSISSVVLCPTTVGKMYCGEFSDFTTVTRVAFLATAGCDFVANVTVVGAVDIWRLLWCEWLCWGTRRIGWAFVVVTSSIGGGSWYPEVEICWWDTAPTLVILWW